jgi:hypothetical protein
MDGSAAMNARTASMSPEQQASWIVAFAMMTPRNDVNVGGSFVQDHNRANGGEKQRTVKGSWLRWELWEEWEL